MFLGGSGESSGRKVMMTVAIDCPVAVVHVVAVHAVADVVALLLL